MRRRLPLLVAIATLWCALSVEGPAHAHIVVGRPTLLSLVAGAELVAHARIVDPQASVTLESTRERRPVVRVELVEVIKGPGEPGSELRFATHGHGVAEYRAGQEALVFLAPLSRSRELAPLAEAGLQWVSFQEHDARWILEAPSRAQILAAARSYAAAGRQTDPQARVEAQRGVTQELLASGDARLAASALRDLVGASHVPLVTADDVPNLLAGVVRSQRATIGLRIGLLAELERRGLVDAAPIWLELLRSTPRPDLLQVVRAAGRHPSPAVDAALVEMVGGDDALAEAAALALGDPAHAAAVPALNVALQRDAPRVRRAAIRALGRIGTPAARNALETAARSHRDAETRHRAAAEIRRQAAGR